jgi:sugar-specific transcriptional regulator TrmB
MSKDILKKFGLSEQEASAYLAILELGTSSIKPIADKSGLKRTSIYNFIDRLISLGLISRTIIRGRNYYTASSPEKLLEIERSRLKELEENLPFFYSLYQQSPSKPRLNYVHGAEQIAELVREETRCKKEALYIWPGISALSSIGGEGVMNKIDKERIKKKIWVKTIRFKKKDKHYGLSVNSPKYFRDMRWAPPAVDIKMGVGIYDTGKVAFFSSPKENFGVLIESKEIQELMTTLFQMFWAVSLPAKEGDG